MYILFFIYVNIPQKPYSYKLKNTSNVLERAELISNLQKELNILKKESYNDGDRYWPKDRTIIVLSIQNYILNFKKLPKSNNDLTSNNFLNIEDLEYKDLFIITSDNMKWYISTAYKKLIAYGN